MGKKLIIPGADFSTNAIQRPTPVSYELVSGYASAGGNSSDPGVSIGTLSTRVRTGQLSGSYTVKTKSGYVIRAIVYYTPSITISGDGVYYVTSRTAVGDVQGLSRYTLNNPDGYSIITFCKTDDTADVSASEDIVDYIMQV